jgi:hypothetical protein
MPFFMMENFDSYTSISQMAGKWGNYSGLLIAGRGPSGKALNGRCARYIPWSISVTVGFACKLSLVRTGATSLVTVGLPSSFPYTWSISFVLGVDFCGRLYVAALGQYSIPSQSPIQCIGSPGSTPQGWSYVEFSATNPGAGGVTLRARVNGMDVLDATFMGSGSWSSGITAVSLAQGLSSYDHVFDDVYILGEERFLGDIRPATLLPNSDGSSLEWLPSVPESPHYQMVLGGTGYVYSEELDKLDLWGVEDLPPGTHVPFANPVLHAQSSEGSTTIVPSCLIGGELVEFPAAILGTSAQQVTMPMSSSPSGGPLTAWDINEMQIGARRIL